MPTYEYECTRGCHFETSQSIKDEPLKRCTKKLCPKGIGGVKVQRLISASNFILKGGGWYADGYASSDGAAKGGESSSSSTTTSEAPKSDSGSGSSSGSSGD